MTLRGWWVAIVAVAIGSMGALSSTGALSFVPADPVPLPGYSTFTELCSRYPVPVGETVYIDAPPGARLCPGVVRRPK